MTCCSMAQRLALKAVTGDDIVAICKAFRDWAQAATTR